MCPLFNNSIFGIFIIFVILAKISVIFTFTANYPDEAPDMEIDESENVTNEDEVLEFLKNTVSTHSFKTKDFVNKKALKNRCI